MTHVVRVGGNVKGEFAYDLSPCTLIVGKNATGKSRAADAIALALTGRAASMGIGKREVDLMALAPPGADALRASVTLSDGTRADWSCKGSTAKASRPEWTGERGTLIMDEAIALLRSDPSHLRAALLARLGGEVSSETLHNMVPTSLWRHWAGERGDTPWTIDEVMTAAEAVNERLKRTRALKKSLDAKLYESAMVETLTDAEVAELDQLSTVSAQQGYSADMIAKMREQAELLERSLISGRADVAQHEEAVRSASGVAPSTVRLISMANDLAQLTVEIAQGHGGSLKCPVCATGILVDRLQQRLAEIQAALETVKNMQASTQGLVSALNAARNHVSMLESQLAQVKRSLSHATLAVPVDRERLAELQQRVSQANEYAEAKRNHALATIDEGELETLKKIAGDIIGTLLDAKVEELQDRVTAALPKGMSVEIALRDGNRKICRVALKVAKNAVARDFRALSGAERAVLVSAFSAALLSTGPADSVRMIIIDDVWFDADTMRSLMESLGATVQSGQGPSQVVVNAVTWHGRAKLPAGWSMVRVDDTTSEKDGADAL